MSTNTYTGPWAPGMLLRTSLHGSHPLGLPGGLPAGTEWRLDGVTDDDADSLYWDLLSEGRCSEDEPCTLVLDDPATVGALAGVVRKLYREPRLSAIYIDWTALDGGSKGWALGWYEFCSTAGTVVFRTCLAKVRHEDTEPAAWLAAYHAHTDPTGLTAADVQGMRGVLDRATGPGTDGAGDGEVDRG